MSASCQSRVLTLSHVTGDGAAPHPKQNSYLSARISLHPHIRNLPTANTRNSPHLVKMPAFPKPPVDVYPLLAVVGVACIASVWSMGRNFLVNPEVCCTKEYREGGSLWDEKQILSKADKFRPFPFILRDLARFGKASTATGEWH